MPVAVRTVQHILHYLIRSNRPKSGKIESKTIAFIFLARLIILILRLVPLELGRYVTTLQPLNTGNRGAIPLFPMSNPLILFLKPAPQSA